MLAVFVFCADAEAQCQYEVTAIITPDDAEYCWPYPPSLTYASGMNNKGEVVGYIVPCALGNERAFHWSTDTGFVLLPHPPGVSQGYAGDINDQGIIVGRHTFAGVGGKGFVYDPATQEYTYLEPLHDGAVATNLTSANAINNNLVIAGSRVISEPGEPVVSNAVIWHPFGIDGEGPEVVIDLGDFGVGPNSAARALNDTGDVVGWTGQTNVNAFGFVRVADGAVVVFDEQWGVTRSICQDIDTAGVVAGGLTLIDPNLTAAFLWGGSDLTVIEPPPGFTGTGTAGLNDLGQLLIRVAPGQLPAIVQHGMLHFLSELVELPPAVALQTPTTLNGAGEILLRGSLSGRTVGLLLQPIERPVTDLNADCVTDIHDLLILLKSWGRCNSDHCPADFTGSGSVGVPDLLILLSNWG